MRKRIQEVDKGIVVDQNKTNPPIESSAARLHEPGQDSNKSIVQTDHPKDRPSWVTVATKTTNATTTTRSTSAKAASSAVNSNAETRITAKTEATSSEFGKIFKKLEEIDKKIAGKSYG